MPQLSKLNVRWDNTAGLCVGVGRVKARRPMTVLELIGVIQHRETLRHLRFAK